MNDRKTILDDDFTARYYNALARGFTMVEPCIDQISEVQSYQAQTIRNALERMTYTIEALRMKHLYEVGESRGMLVDMSATGFPGHIEFHHMEAESTRSEKFLEELPDLPTLQARLADQLFQGHGEDSQTLSLLAQRAYIEMIRDKKKLFLPVSMFEPEHVGRSANGNLSYRMGWTCFDYKRNRPHVYIMLFEQSQQDDDVATNGPAHFQLMQTVKHFGARSPEIGILATQIDDALPYTHPKVLRRFTIESFSTAEICAFKNDGTDRKSKMLLELFKKHGTPDDVVMTFSEHTVVSERQVRSGILGLGQIREVFTIRQDDLLLAEQKATSIKNCVLLPHKMLQAIDGRYKELIEPKTTVFTYTEKGEVHAIR
jgi:hypothetical protein